MTDTAGLRAGDVRLAGRGLRKTFGPVVALDDVRVEVQRGHVLALAGENGSGKSTLARILAGVFAPDAGELTLDGAPTSFGSPRDAIARGIAFVTQELTAVPALSIAENVLLTRLHNPARPFRRGRIVREARPYLALAGLDDVDPLVPFESLPPGRRELVEVAKALASEPRVLILDEATTRLPEPEFLFRLVERLSRERGLATVFITQRLREILRIADRALVLRDGRVAGELAREELSEGSLTRLMVGRELTGYFHKLAVQPGEVALRVDALVTDRSPHPLSFEVRAGEIVGVSGLVGSGRTELLETVVGARRSRGGEVTAGGRRLRPGSVPSALRAGLTLLPEDRHAQGLVLDASVQSNIAMARLRALARTDRRGERVRASEAVRRMHIRCRDVDAEVATLSGGNQQKVVFARALARDPRVLLLDEPTRGVDVGAREEIYAIVGELVSGGAGVLLASSDLPEVLGLSDRVLVLCEGRLAGELSRSEATEERVMALAAGLGTEAAA